MKTYDPQPPAPKVTKFNSIPSADGGGDNQDGMLAMREFQMPGGAGTSQPVVIKPSKPVNTNPFHNAGNPSPAEFGMGKGEQGAI